jgi:DNA excision repair protein ERCC-3
VGIGVLYRVQSQALIISTNITALRQWRRELLEKTNLDPEQIGEYSGDRKEIRPITLTTYQMLTFRKKKLDELVHFRLFSARDWGLIIYDEVHLLPAPVFRLTAEIQATRRLGLTATLVREDGREDEVFSLIGPRKYDLPWRSLEAQGWIANASCVELRCPLGGEDAQRYLTADRRGKFRIASENATKLEVLKSIVQRHRADRVLIIGQYLDQLKRIQRELAASHHHRQDPFPGARKAVRELSVRRHPRPHRQQSGAISPSTCRTPTSPCRSPARSAPARRKRSASAASSDPRPMAGPPSSTRS